MANQSIAASARSFWVRATRDIDDDIKRGDYILIASRRVDGAAVGRWDMEPEVRDA